MTMTDSAPDAADIRHFVSKVREIDKRVAVDFYVRNGRSMQEAPDEKVIRVLEWLERISSDGECHAKEKTK